MKNILLSATGFALLKYTNCTQTSKRQGGGRVNSQEENLIQNGNFNFPQLKTEYQIINAQQDGNQMKLKEVQAQYIIPDGLDGSKNNVLKQRISLVKGRYTLSFKWAARSSRVNTSAMEVYWNNIKIFEVSGKDEQINLETKTVLPIAQNRYLKQQTSVKHFLSKWSAEVWDKIIQIY